MPHQRVIVLKLGGSVLLDEACLALAVAEVHRWRRDGWRVAAVVSALEGTTDRLLAHAARYGPAADAHATAALVATGELTSAALLGLALHAAGVRAEVLDAAAIGLRTHGAPLDAGPEDLDAGALRDALDRAGVVVVPGFLGRDEFGRTTLLGRGGSDFTALFLASRLGARCRLIKDVPGLYEHDPRLEGTRPRLYRTVSWDGALRLDGGIVQHKAVRFAQEAGLEFEVAALRGERATVVGRGPSAFAADREGVRDAVA